MQKCQTQSNQHEIDVKQALQTLGDNKQNCRSLCLTVLTRLLFSFFRKSHRKLVLGKYYSRQVQSISSTTMIRRHITFIFFDDLQCVYSFRIWRHFSQIFSQVFSQSFSQSSVTCKKSTENILSHVIPLSFCSLPLLLLYFSILTTSRMREKIMISLETCRDPVLEDPVLKEPVLKLVENYFLRKVNRTCSYRFHYHVILQ